MRIWGKIAVSGFFIMLTIGTGPGMCADDTGPAGKDSKQQLVVTLDLASSKAYFGESVPFTITLSHTFDSPLSTTSFLDTNRSLKITLTGKGGKSYTTDQRSHKERDGFYLTEPPTKEGTSLAPGQKLELKGDLIEWFGNIPPGKYRAEVTYTGILRFAKSRAVPLMIAPISISSASVSKCGAQPDDTSFSSAWVHQGKDASLVFYRTSSPHVPGNPIHCVEAAKIKGQVSDYGAACITGPHYSFGTVYWIKRDREFSFARADLKTGKPGLPTQVKLPFAGRLTGSPLLLSDGTLFAPFTVTGKDEFVLMSIPSSGSSRESRFSLAGLSASGRVVCFWEFEKKLHLFWDQPDQGAIKYSFLDLSSVDKGFSSPKAIGAKGVIWFEPYRDKTIPVKDLRALYLGEGPPPPEETLQPKIKLWLVAKKPDGFMCTQISVEDGSPAQTVLLKSKNAQGLQAMDSVVTPENDLSLLLTDSKGKIYYGSTVRGAAVPLDKVIGRKVRMSDCPHLVKSRTGPWVHLQYIQKGKSIEYVRLEPEDEPDPVEKSKEGR